MRNFPSSAERRFTEAPLHRSRMGYSLIEMLVYLSVFAIIAGLSFTAYLQCQRNSAALRRNSEDIARALQAGERWRADVRASATPKLVTRSGNDELHLTGSHGEIVYVFQDSAVWRKADGHRVRFLDRVKTSRMIQDRGARVTSLRWEIELGAVSKEVRVKPMFTFQAVPGGKA